MWFRNIEDAKTVQEYIYPHGSRITLRLGRLPDSRLFNVERQVDGSWQAQTWGVSRAKADGIIRDWGGFSERIGAELTTDKYEKTHCPWCLQTIKEKPVVQAGG